MRDKKRLTSLFIIGLAAICLLNGCKKNGNETEKQTESTQTESTPAETESASKTYTSESSTFSIDLPDNSWNVTTEGIKNKWVFQAEGVGQITIAHRKSKLKAKNLPQSQEEAIALLNKEKANAFEEAEFKKESISNADLYYYAAGTSDSELGYRYFIRYLINAEKEGYTITAKLSVSDAESIQAVKNAVTSFQILREDSKKTSEDGENQEDGGKPENKDDSVQDEENEDSGSSDAAGTDEEYRYFFDSEGNTVYAYPSDDGVWRDKDGNVSFSFWENGVEDSNGKKYSYDPPQYQNDSSGNESGQSSSSGGQIVDFYDANGNYITATQNADGRWMGSDGKTYTFSEEGVTDSDGNFSKW